MRGVAAPGLTDSYDAERRPVGEEGVGMTGRNAREGIGVGESSAETAMRKQAQLLISYAGSPLLSESDRQLPSCSPGNAPPMRED